MAVSLIDCCEEHLPALRVFLARTYRPNYILAVNEKFFRWQFGKTLRSEEVIYNFKLALLDGAIAGCLGYIPVEVSYDIRVVRGAWVVNWMVDANQRRLGLGPFLMREVTRQFDVTLNVGPNQDARDTLSRMRWANFGELQRQVCVLDAEAAGALTETGTIDWPVEMLDRLSLPSGPEPSHQVVVRLIDRFDGDATSLWDRAWGAQEATAGTRRSAEFLNWRYADHPLLRYRLFEARHQGRVIGLAVYRVEQVRDLPVRVGRLVELLCETKEDDLLAAVLSDARLQGVAMMDFFCASSRLAAAMARCGFLPDDNAAVSRLPILFQPIDRQRSGISFMAYFGNAAEGAEVRDWYVTKADGDQDRPN